MMKDKKVLYSTIVVAILLIAGGAYALLGNKSQTPQKQEQDNQQEEVLTLKPEDIGLKIQLRNDKKAIRFVIEKPQDIKTVEYQISYTKEISGEQLPEGLIGDAKLKPGESTISIEYREFGTCSKNVCRYDTVVSPIKIVLKVTKNDDRVYHIEATQALE